MTEPNWQQIADLLRQQRDRAEAKANNLEIDLAIVRARLDELTAKYEPPAE